MTRIDIGGDGLGEEISGRRSESLKEAAEVENVYRRGEYADNRRHYEDRRGDYHDRFASVAVADGTEQELPGSETNHAHGETHLPERYRTPEETAHGGERRRVHVVDKGALRAEYNEKQHEETVISHIAGERNGKGRRVVHEFLLLYYNAGQLKKFRKSRMSRRHFCA